MEIFDFAPQQFMSFVLTLFRISLIMFLMPFFGGESIPRTVKVSICIVMTLALWPHLGFKDAILPAHPLGIAVMMLGELILGLILAGEKFTEQMMISVPFSFGVQRD